MNKGTIIIGHKNPDTDSICSAIGYEALKKAKGETGFIAARAGNVNPQTGFALKYFGKEPPPYLADVHPRVRDVMTRDIASAPKETPLSDSIKMMGEKNVRFMPITDKGVPIGLLALSTLAEHLMVKIPSPTREIWTSIGNVIKATHANPLHAISIDEEFNSSVFVGAMSEESFQGVIENHSPKNCIVIVGDREDIQACAISRGVRLLVVTGGLSVREDILKTAREKGVNVVVSAFDSAITAWLTMLSSPVGHFCSRDLTRVNETETLRSFRGRFREGMGVVVDAGGKLTGVVSPYDMNRPSGIRLILVDHNELSQAVDGASDVEIVEVIDHHRLGNFHTSSPIKFINEPVGSTSTLIAEKFVKAGISPDRQTAGLLLSGMISDTLMLKSPTATQRDREMVERMAAIAGVDPLAYSGELFRAGSGISGKTPVEILSADFKTYEVKGRKFGIGQVEVVGFAEFYEMRKGIEEEVARMKEAKDYALAGILVTDISYGNSLLLAVSDSDIEHGIGYPAKDRNLYELKGVLSRKKQVVPHLFNLFTNL